MVNSRFVSNGKHVCAGTGISNAILDVLAKSAQDMNHAELCAAPEIAAFAGDDMPAKAINKKVSNALNHLRHAGKIIKREDEGVCFYSRRDNKSGMPLKVRAFVPLQARLFDHWNLCLRDLPQSTRSAVFSTMGAA
jgi:hypothetical protein